MKNICFINGSLRGKEASSLAFINRVSNTLGNSEFNKEFITVRAKISEAYPEDTVKKIAGADAVIMAFPLFSYGLPGALMRLLEDYSSYISRGNEYKRETRVYVIVNCGFPRPAINEEAVRTVRNFCRRLGLNWRFAVCIASGPVAAVTQKIPLLNLKISSAYRAIAMDIENSGSRKMENFYIKPVLPEPIILMIKAQFEKKMNIQPAGK